MPLSAGELASHVLQLCRERIHAPNAPGLIAITGTACSGKSTLSRLLGWHARSLGFEVTLHHLSDYQSDIDEWPVTVPAEDGYYEYGFGIPAFLDAVHRDAASRRDGTAGFVVAEGEFLLKEKFRTLWDFSVWMEAADDLVIERARTRHLEGANARELEAIRSPDSVEEVYRTLCLPALRHHLTVDRPQEFATMAVRSLEDGWEVLRAPNGDAPPAMREARRE